MNPTVTLTIDNTKQIEVELFPEVAENSVNNFLSLASDHFYDGLIFHRVIPGFMIQGGCPKKDGTGNPGYSIAGEFSQNGFKNDLKHTKGVLSMARAQNPDSAGSQFFIMAANSPHLDGSYAAFGQVVSGLEVVDEIVNVPRNRMDKPHTDVVITSTTVNLNGYQPKPVVKK